MSEHINIPKRLILRGREFNQDDLAVILGHIESYWNEGRTKISEEICKTLNWTQANGWPKDRACRDVLRRLEYLKLVELPPSKSSASSPPYSKRKDPLGEPAPQGSVSITATDGPLVFKLAKGNHLEQTWNDFVRRYHYLGHKVIVGRTLKFMVMSGMDCLAAASLSESAWSVKERDEALAALGLSRGMVANNSRFLILPGVKIKNLASKILGILAGEGPLMWEKYYGTQLLCLETFVDMSRYKGTCYAAANWIEVGATKGYKKSGSLHSNSQSPKRILLYPLSHALRLKLVNFVKQKM